MSNPKIAERPSCIAGTHVALGVGVPVLDIIGPGLSHSYRPLLTFMRITSGEDSYGFRYSISTLSGTVGVQCTI